MTISSLALFNLPPELRLQIYDHYFGPTKACTLALGKNVYSRRFRPPCDNSNVSRVDAVALLLSNRNVYAEALPVLLERTNFQFSIDDHHCRIDREKGGISTREWRLLGSVDAAGVLLRKLRHVSLATCSVQDAELVGTHLTRILSVLDFARRARTLTLTLCFCKEPERALMAANSIAMRSVECEGTISIVPDSLVPRAFDSSMFRGCRELQAGLDVSVLRDTTICALRNG